LLDHAFRARISYQPIMYDRDFHGSFLQTGFDRKYIPLRNFFIIIHTFYLPVRVRFPGKDRFTMTCKNVTTKLSAFFLFLPRLRFIKPVKSCGQCRSLFSYTHLRVGAQVLPRPQRRLYLYIQGITNLFNGDCPN